MSWSFASKFLLLLFYTYFYSGRPSIEIPFTILSIFLQTSRSHIWQYRGLLTARWHLLQYLRILQYLQILQYLRMLVDFLLFCIQYQLSMILILNWLSILCHCTQQYPLISEKNIPTFWIDKKYAELCQKVRKFWTKVRTTPNGAKSSAIGLKRCDSEPTVLKRCLCLSTLVITPS